MAEEQLPGANEQPVDQPTGGNLQPTENENISEENIQYPTLKTQHNEDNMEVHKHTHHVTHKKKWKEYLFEFFMLFLAVFAGFLAENQREHYTENQRTKQYAVSLANDLKKDTGAFRVLKESYTKDIIKIDTFRNMLKNRSIKEIPTAALYYYCEPVIWSKGITFHDATLQQLKNSGSLRYFPAKLQNKISEYDRMARELSSRQENEIYFSRISREMMTEIFDAESILTVTNLSTPYDVEEFKKKNISLIKKDTLSIKKLVNEIIYRQASWQFRLKQIIQPSNVAATDLLKDLVKKNIIWNKSAVIHC